MFQVGQATLRQMWDSHRLAWTVIFAWLVSLSVAYQLAPQGAMTLWVGPLVFLPMLFVFLYLIAVMAYGWEVEILSGRSCFPGRLFLLPLSSFELVFWPLALGQLAIVVLWGTIELFILRRSGIELTWWRAPLQLMVILAWVQALLWTPFRIAGARVACLNLLLLLTLGFLGLAEQHAWPPAVHAGVLVVALMLAYVTAYRGVARARYDPEPEGWRFPSIWAFLQRLVPQRSAFASAEQAQLWMEWRIFGREVFVGTGLMLAMMIPLLPLCEQPFLELFQSGYLPVIPGMTPGTMTTITLLAVLSTVGPIYSMAGIQTGGAFPSSKSLVEMSPFFASRPMTNEQLVVLKYRNACCSALSGWAIAVLSLATWVGLTGRYRAFGEFQDAMGYNNLDLLTFLGGWLLLVLVLTVACMLWARFIILSGRRWLIGLTTFLGILGGIALQMTVAGSQSPDARYWDALMRVLPWFLGSLLAVKAIAFGYTLLAVEHRPRASTTLWVSSIWAILLVGLSWWGIAFFFHSTIERATWCVALALLLPLSRLLAGPLMLAWNRHR